jgi:hypothetical protein
METEKLSPLEKFTAYLARERIVPGNEAPKVGKKLFDIMEKYQNEGQGTFEQEVRKDLSALMEAVTSLTRLYNILIKGMEDIRTAVKGGVNVKPKAEENTKQD